MGNVNARAQAGWLRHSRSAFDFVMVLENPSGQTVQLNGIGTRHSINIDTDGNLVNSPNVHVSFHETEFNEAITEQGVTFKPIRHMATISLKGHFVYFPDSSGVVFKYRIQEYWPDTTVGMIICMCQVTERTTFESVQNVCNS